MCGGRASVAQLAEQLICNQQVVGSSPSAGSGGCARVVSAGSRSMTWRGGPRCGEIRSARYSFTSDGREAFGWARRSAEADSPQEGSYPSGQRGQTVNLLAYAFAGSNPALPTYQTAGGRLSGVCVRGCVGGYAGVAQW